MKNRFEGDQGRERLLRALKTQKLCLGDDQIVKRIADAGELLDLATEQTLIRQGDADTELYFILLGRFDVFVNGGKVNERGPGVHVGEVAGLDSGQKRSATLIATEPSVALKVSDAEFRKLLDEHPKIAEAMAIVANQRLVERNALVAICNDRPHILVVSSKEALGTAREVQSQLRDDDFVVRPWDQGVFTLSDYPIPALERALDETDFAIIVAQPDDTVVSRGQEKPVPRDNVTFEMGLAIGKLGLDRTIILQPSDREAQLASDATGLTTARYRSADPPESALGPACNDNRKHIRKLQVRRTRSAVLVSH